MARPLRLEFEGAVYNITARGNERKPIFIDDEDRIRFLNILKELTENRQIILYCYCLMTNHYHLLLETPYSNLIRTMHTIQTRYTMYFNFKHKRVGHLFQGRYKSLIVDKENYLLELSRYIHLNPVRAGIVKRAEDYRWSSCRDYLQEKVEIVERDFILQTISDYYDVDIEYLLNRKRRWNNIRKVSIYFVRKYTDQSLKAIAEHFGGVHYSAINQIVRRMEKRIEDDELLNEAINVIQNKLKVKT